MKFDYTKLFLSICFSLIISASLTHAKDPNYNISNGPVTAQVAIIGDSTGKALELTGGGELPVNASVSVTSNNSILVDDDGDTLEIRADGSGEMFLTGSSLDLATNAKIQELIDNLNDTSSENAQDENFRDQVVLSSSGDTALVEFITNGDSQPVKAWSMIPQGTDIHFTTKEGANVSGSDMLVISGTTWGETNRSAKKMEVEIMADDSSGTVFIRGRGQ